MKESKSESELLCTDSTALVPTLVRVLAHLFEGYQ
jgi:hypothetical protein